MKGPRGIIPFAKVSGATAAWLLGALALTAVLTGCGPAYDDGNGPGGIPGPSQPGPRPSNSPTPSDDPRWQLPNPPILREVRGVGYDATVTFQVYFKDILKIRFVPRQQDRSVEGSNVSPQYSELGVHFALNGRAEAYPTPMLSNGMAREVEAYDVEPVKEGWINKACTDRSPDSCRQRLTITVKMPNYDYWCWSYQTYCGMNTHVHPTHPWVGNVYVETDDTRPIE